MAHKLDKTARTRDVLASENMSFSDLHLSEFVIEGLTREGFEKPSPIQVKAIPLGRCGLDLIVQAKSGTGKTCVFSVIALDSLLLSTSCTQVLVLAPTREIALQIQQVVQSIGAAMPNLKCCTFIGGLPVQDDVKNLKNCHVAIGTPGRVKQLIDEGHMEVDSIRLFVLDEADKLMEADFQQVINWIYSSLPSNKQMLALSATYPEVLAQHLTRYMRNPTFIRLNATDPALLGIRQYYQRVPFQPVVQRVYENKTRELIHILSSVDFNQCLVFSNYQMRAQSLSDVLNARGWPATYISGAQEQQDRMAAMASLKQYECRVLISTDLTSRGIDAENVNLVINLDFPKEQETYLHRIGRAGRFGTYGAGISLVGSDQEMAQLRNIEDKCNTVIQPLPDPIPTDLAKSSGYVHYNDLVTTEQIITDKHDSDDGDKSYEHDDSNGASHSNAELEKMSDVSKCDTNKSAILNVKSAEVQSYSVKECGVKTGATVTISGEVESGVTSNAERGLGKQVEVVSDKESLVNGTQDLSPQGAKNIFQNIKSDQNGDLDTEIDNITEELVKEAKEECLSLVTRKRCADSKPEVQNGAEPITESGDRSETSHGIFASVRKIAKGRRKQKLHPWGDWIMQDEQTIEDDARRRETRQRVQREDQEAIFSTGEDRSPGDAEGSPEVNRSAIQELDAVCVKGKIDKAEVSGNKQQYKEGICENDVFMEKQSDSEIRNGHGQAGHVSPKFMRSKTSDMKRELVVYDDDMFSRAAQCDVQQLRDLAVVSPTGSDSTPVVTSPTSPSRHMIPKTQVSATRTLPSEHNPADIRPKDLKIAKDTSPVGDAFFRLKPRKAPENEQMKTDGERDSAVSNPVRSPQDVDVKISEKGIGTDQKAKSQTRAKGISRSKIRNIAVYDDLDIFGDGEPPRNQNPNNRRAVSYGDMDMFSSTPPKKKDKGRKEKSAKQDTLRYSREELEAINGSSGTVSLNKSTIDIVNTLGISKQNVEISTSSDRGDVPKINVKSTSLVQDVKEPSFRVMQVSTQKSKLKKNKDELLSAFQSLPSSKENEEPKSDVTIPALKNLSNSKLGQQNVSAEGVKSKTKAQEKLAPRSEIASRKSPSKMGKIPSKQSQASVSKEYEEAKKTIADFLKGGGEKPRAYKCADYEKTLEDLGNFASHFKAGTLEVYLSQLDRDFESRICSLSEDGCPSAKENQDPEKLRVADLRSAKHVDLSACAAVMLRKLRHETRQLTRKCECEDFTLGSGQSSEGNPKQSPTPREKVEGNEDDNVPQLEVDSNDSSVITLQSGNAKQETQETAEVIEHKAQATDQRKVVAFPQGKEMAIHDTNALPSRGHKAATHDRDIKLPERAAEPSVPVTRSGGQSVPLVKSAEQSVPAERSSEQSVPVAKCGGQSAPVAKTEKSVKVSFGETIERDKLTSESSGHGYSSDFETTSSESPSSDSGSAVIADDATTKESGRLCSYDTSTPYVPPDLAQCSAGNGDHEAVSTLELTNISSFSRGVCGDCREFLARDQSRSYRSHIVDSPSLLEETNLSGTYSCGSGYPHPHDETVNWMEETRNPSCISRRCFRCGKMSVLETPNDLVGNQSARFLHTDVSLPWGDDTCDQSGLAKVCSNCEEILEEIEHHDAHHRRANSPNREYDHREDFSSAQAPMGQVCDRDVCYDGIQRLTSHREEMFDNPRKHSRHYTSHEESHAAKSYKYHNETYSQNYSKSRPVDGRVDTEKRKFEKNRNQYQPHGRDKSYEVEDESAYLHKYPKPSEFRFRQKKHHRDHAHDLRSSHGNSYWSDTDYYHSNGDYDASYHTMLQQHYLHESARMYQYYYTLWWNHVTSQWPVGDELPQDVYYDMYKAHAQFADYFRRLYRREREKRGLEQELHKQKSYIRSMSRRR